MPILVDACGTVRVVRDGKGIVEWTKEYLENLDQRGPSKLGSNDKEDNDHDKMFTS